MLPLSAPNHEGQKKLKSSFMVLTANIYHMPVPFRSKAEDWQKLSLASKTLGDPLHLLLLTYR